MKASQELIQHISTTFWDNSNKSIAQCLEDFKGNPLREEETPLEVKHPIKLVNEKYPNGWYCEAFEEVVKDVKDKYGCDLFGGYKYIGVDKYKSWFWNISGKVSDDSTLIPKSEYLAITRGVEEQPTIQVEKSSDIEERVKALESKCEDIVKETSLHIEAINKIVTGLNSKVYGYCDSSLPTKRNLSTDIPTIDWKKVECLSWEDVVKININCSGMSLGANLETLIKNKLKSKATL